MEFQISVDELSKALYRAQGIVEKKSTMPILSSVLIERTVSLRHRPERPVRRRRRFVRRGWAVKGR